MGKLTRYNINFFFFFYKFRFIYFVHIFIKMYNIPTFDGRLSSKADDWLELIDLVATASQQDGNLLQPASVYKERQRYGCLPKETQQTGRRFAKILFNDLEKIQEYTSIN